MSKSKLNKLRKDKAASPHRSRVNVKTFDLDDPNAPRKVFTRRPDEWFETHLGRFLDASHAGIVSRAVVDPTTFQALCLYDRAFNALKHSLLESNRPFFYPFFIRSYSMWLASVRTYLAGQLPECYPTLRSGVEAICYGYHFETSHNKSELFKAWMDRSLMSDGQRRDEMRNFSFKKLTAMLDEDTKKILSYLYESSISYGAHPNVEGIFFNVRSEEDGYGYQFLGADEVDYQVPGYILARAAEAIITVIHTLEPEIILKETISDALYFAMQRTEAMYERMMKDHPEAEEPDEAMPDSIHDMFFAALSSELNAHMQSEECVGQTSDEAGS